MPINYNIEKDALYKMGMEKEREKWEKEHKIWKKEYARWEKERIRWGKERRRWEKERIRWSKERKRVEVKIKGIEAKCKEFQREVAVMEVEWQQKKEQAKLELREEKKEVEVTIIKNLLQLGILTDAQIIETMSITSDFLHTIKQHK